MTDFKVGDRVRSTEAWPYTFGKVGTVVVIDSDNDVGVRFDESFVCGHDLYGKCDEGHGRWYLRGTEELELVVEDPQETGCFIVVGRDSTGSSDGGGVMAQCNDLGAASTCAEDRALRAGGTWVVFKAVKAFERSSKEIPV